MLGVQQLHGTARSIEVARLKHDVKHILRHLLRLEDCLSSMWASRSSDTDTASGMSPRHTNHTMMSCIT